MGSLDDAFNSFLDLVKDGHSFSISQVRQIVSPPVVVFDGHGRQRLAVDLRPFRQLLDAQHHVAAQSDVVGGQGHR